MSYGKSGVYLLHFSYDIVNMLKLFGLLSEPAVKKSLNSKSNLGIFCWVQKFSLMRIFLKNTESYNICFISNLFPSNKILEYWNNTVLIWIRTRNPIFLVNPNLNQILEKLKPEFNLGKSLRTRPLAHFP